MNLNNFRIRITDSAVIHLRQPADAGDAISDINAEIYYDTEKEDFDCEDRNDKDHECRIGSLSGFRINAKALGDDNYPEGIFDLADSESQDLTDIFGALLTKSRYLEDVRNDILVVDRLHVVDKFRGFDLGLHLIESLLNSYVYDFATLLVAPVDYMGPLTVGRRKLRKYYARLGFEQIGRTQVMALHHSQQKRLQPKEVKKWKR